MRDYGKKYVRQSYYYCLENSSACVSFGETTCIMEGYTIRLRQSTRSTEGLSTIVQDKSIPKKKLSRRSFFPNQST